MGSERKPYGVGAKKNRRGGDAGKVELGPAKAGRLGLGLSLERPYML